MQNNSIFMHYLQSLVKPENAEAKQENAESFSFIVSDDVSVINDILEKKIQVIKEIRNIYNTNAKKAAIFFAPFADRCLNLQRTYQETLKTYREKIINGTQVASTEVLIEIADKMILAAILESVIFSERKNYREHLQLLEQLLYDLSCKWSGQDGIKKFDSKLELFTDEIRKPIPYVDSYSNFHNRWNIWRFAFARLWRLINNYLSQVLIYFNMSIDLIQTLRDNGVKSFFAYLSWIFFIPRLLINFCKLTFACIGILPIFSTYKLPDVEKELGWYSRLKIRLKVNGVFYEMTNDSMWFVSGVISCFILAGAVPIIGIYVMLATQIYDFAAFMLQNFLEIRRLNQFKEDLKSLASDNKISYKKSIDNLSKSIEFEKDRLLYGIFNFAALLMCVVFLTPAFVNISPFIPFVACFIMVVLAPLRGMTLDYFRKQGSKANSPLIPKNSYGALLIETAELESIESKQYLLRRYSQGVVFVRIENGYEVYRYDKNSKPKLIKCDGIILRIEDDKFVVDRNNLESLTLDASEFLLKSTTDFQDYYSRAITVRAALLQKMDISFLKEDKKPKFHRSVSSQYSSPI